MAIDQKIVSAVAVVSVLFAGSWTVFQTQFGYISGDAKVLRDALYERTKDVDRKLKDISIQVDDLRGWTNKEFETRRALNVEQVEFRQFEQRFEERIKNIQDRLTLIEQTRPTTGELQGVAKNTNDQIARIIDRLDRFEQQGKRLQ